MSDESIDETMAALLEASVSSEYIGSKIKDKGRLSNRIKHIKDTFMSRKDDILKEKSNDLVKSSLNDLHDVLVSYDKMSSKWKKDKVWIFKTNARQRKVDKFLVDLQASWSDLLMNVSLDIAGQSSQQAKTATGNVAKIALATGHPDWEILDQGQAEQFCIQGDKYLFGYGVKQSNDTAFLRYMAAAKYGLPEAANMVATMFENGIGRQPDLPNAIFWYKEAASKGHADANNHLGRLYETGKGVPQDYKIATEKYMLAAEKNHPDAQTNLGQIYEKGAGCEEDHSRAYAWYRLAAEQDYARAQNAIGSLHYRGVGAEHDFSEAVKWFRKAAEQGNPHAQNNLGICYEEGKGVVKDFVLAKQYYQMAAANHHPSATNNLGYLLLLEKKYEEAFARFHLGQALGCVDSIYNIGTMYEAGLGVVSDGQLAFKYYSLASEKGSVKGLVKLGQIYCQGILAERNYSLAYECFKKAALLDDNEGQNGLGQMYELGLGVKANPREAVKWYIKSAKQGNPIATFNLANALFSGKGFDKADAAKAIHYFKEAEKLGHPEARNRLEEIFVLTNGDMYSNDANVTIGELEEQDNYNYEDDEDDDESFSNLKIND